MNQKSSILSKISIGYLLFATTVVVAVFYIGFTAGKINGTRSIVPEGEGKVLNQGDMNKFAGENVDFRQFWEVWNLIKDAYVDQPVSEKDMYYGALQGLMSSLNDPYSMFFVPTEADAFTKDLEGKFFGIGAEIGLKDDHIIIVAPLAESPAEKAGIQAGDIIVSVDEKSTKDWGINETVLNIRGEKGTPVTLEVVREGVDAPFDITIVRGEITIDSVKWEIRDDGIAVVSIFMFNEDTTVLFQKAVQEILTEDVKGVIIDVRNDPGGLLSEAINIAGFWIDGDTVVIEKVGDVERPFRSQGAPRLAGMPTVVLVNGGSASASEILAGALQDFGAATIIGEQTYGKGSVQEYHEFEDGSALKMTTAKWLTPKGRSISNTGIAPDIIVEYTLDDFNEERTPQLDAALDFLKAIK
ncbi:hypothetical protein CO173_04830 [Candidatus Uhrbacteria bacterium CG_4_9_14_3_um_filter_41_35]|uniref:PDZ domain-containing protein n=1 Tax=Candidatus Uhrbacteria bacterium CG_4_9_14_3_um_filter_41_35 TaxID=1975034 RepID=A0A2M7XCZ3_9BACT|nr:MAG: peptidase S41 [Candidatus Uhrbacteria bacterium CG11_big_fil_rev_8_21_14_0_20_41_9]PJA45747.1 MAG: hypothetical protein CO173_04830 [Candidatus Uhrbacteria bacterium CG_4_9_14_3_um_filter_41_35]